MSPLDHPEAQALLNDATVLPDTVRNCTDHLTAFLDRYLPKFYRAEQRRNATLVIRGLLSGLERKTCEPITSAAGVPHKPIQFFVGAGLWDDEAVMADVWLHLRETLAGPETPTSTSCSTSTAAAWTASSRPSAAVRRRRNYPGQSPRPCALRSDRRMARRFFTSPFGHKTCDIKLSR
jgi:hypothetical protein